MAEGAEIEGGQSNSTENLDEGRSLEESNEKTNSVLCDQCVFDVSLVYFFVALFFINALTAAQSNQASEGVISAVGVSLSIDSTEFRGNYVEVSLNCELKHVKSNYR